MKIWIIRVLSLWDSIVAYPLIELIKKKYPDSQITLFAWWWISKDYFQRIDEIDNVLSLKWIWSSFLFKLKIILSNFKKYDLVIDTIQGSKMTNIIAKLFSKKCFWFEEFWKYSKTYKWIINDKDFVILQDLAPYIQPNEEINLNLRFPIYDKDIVTLKSKINIPKKTFIVFHPSSAKWFNSKKISLHQVNSIIDYIIKKNLDVCLIGTKDDAEMIDLIKDRSWLHKFHNKSLTIRETWALINKSKMYIWLNSGPMWISLALKKETIVINWPSSLSWIPPEKYYPWVHNINTHYKKCSIPCEQKICKYNKEWIWKCMENLDLNELYKNINMLLDF